MRLSKVLGVTGGTPQVNPVLRTVWFADHHCIVASQSKPIKGAHIAKASSLLRTYFPLVRGFNKYIKKETFL